MSYDAARTMGKKRMNTTAGSWDSRPRRNPEIVVAAVVQDTTGTAAQTAGPVVRDIVKAYYDKKARRICSNRPSTSALTSPPSSNPSGQRPSRAFG